MYIKRNLEGTILRYLDAPEIIAVVGPRQSGKTTMIHKMIENLPKAASVCFDDRVALGLFERSTDEFIAAYIKGNNYLFIDEFQYAKDGGKILKYIFDSQKIKIIISGSSALDLTVKAVKFLVGRILVFQLYPFDFREFLRARDEHGLKLYEQYKARVDFTSDNGLIATKEAHQILFPLFEEYLIFGGYPRVALESRIDAKKELLRNIYNTYFLREVRDILGLIDDYKLNSLIQALALQIGGLIEYSDLSRVSGFSYAALKRYLNFLERSYICHFIKPFYKNKRVEIVKNPKPYFFDTGLRNSIVNDFRHTDRRTDKGALLENGLAMQFIKGGRDFKFWRDKKKNEIDFVIGLGDGRTIAVESKSYIATAGSPQTAMFERRYPEIKAFISYESIKEAVYLNRAFPVYLY